MAEQNRNIAELARNTKYLFSPGIGYVDDRVMLAIPKLYNFVRKIPTRKGEWSVHQRSGLPHFLDQEQKPSDGFCAVYERKGKPRTLFTGQLEDAMYVNSTAEELSKMVLEQRRWLAEPPRRLTANNGRVYGCKRAMALYGLAALGLLADVGVSAYGKFTGNFEYESLIEMFSKNFQSRDDIMLLPFIFLGVLVTIAAATYGNAYIVGKLGEKADKRREENLPERAKTLFLYGPVAEGAILTDHATMREEVRRIQLYQELESIGGTMPKSDFLLLDNAMITRKREAIAQIVHSISQNPQVLQGVPLESLLRLWPVSS